MAEARRFFCGSCGHSITAWSDGNPYYLTPSGEKVYAYHPSEEFNLCIAVDSPTLCLSCGVEYMVDSQNPISACPECGSEDISSTFHLSGRPCPYCKSGTFRRDPNYHAVS